MSGEQEGVVVQVLGGLGVTRRLDVLGIKPGARLKVTSRSPLRGPVTVRIGNAQIALGFGMASKIVLEVEAGASG
jgi:ferrous iron transport protein A